MSIQLSDHFTYKKLMRFTVPSIGMMVFAAIYGVVDGFFVSNYAGKLEFAAINYIMPVLMILGTVGFMFGAGGSALVAIALGEGKREEAVRRFSILVYITLILGVIVSVVGMALIENIAIWLGATPEMVDICAIYGRIILSTLPAFMLQMEFQSFFVVAEKPQMGFVVTLIAGITNMVLDAVLVGWLGYGVVGAAIATATSQLVGGVVPFVYFARPNKTVLRLVKTKLDAVIIRKAAVNGSSELMSNISMSVVSMVYNAQLMKYSGENGVATYGVIMYVGFIFISVFIGYAIGAAPIVGYNYGANNDKELKNVFYKSLRVIGIFAILMFGFCELLAGTIAKIYVGYDAELMEMAIKAFRFYSFAYLFAGFSIYGSSFFTALGNGIISAIISFMRTLVFQISAVLILPLIWGLDGIWIASVVCEVMSVTLTAFFLINKRKKYNY